MKKGRTPGSHLTWASNPVCRMRKISPEHVAFQLRPEGRVKSWERPSNIIVENELK